MGYYPRIRDLREDKDLSIREIAELLHMHRTTYYNYETGKRELPFELAITLAKFYDVSLDYIAGLTNEITPQRKKMRQKDYVSLCRILLLEILPKVEYIVFHINSGFRCITYPDTSRSRIFQPFRCRRDLISTNKVSPS